MACININYVNIVNFFCSKRSDIRQSVIKNMDFFFNDEVTFSVFCTIEELIKVRNDELIAPISNYEADC